MQTFLPLGFHYGSLDVLDNKRLGKQRVEAKQIINALEGKTKGWVNHPATRMWIGALPLLKQYHDWAIHVWVRRGFKNNMPLYYRPLSDGSISRAPMYESPEWALDDNVAYSVFLSHRIVLYQKDPKQYGRFEKESLAWKAVNQIKDDVKCVWPVSMEEAKSLRAMQKVQEVLDLCS